jgi:hypothetical protein
LRKVNFWTVNKNVRIDPNECLFPLRNEDHIFVQHEVTVIFYQLFCSINNLKGNLKRKVVRTELTEDRDFVAFVFFCPNLLSLINEFSKKDFWRAWDVVFLSFFILWKLFRRLDGNLEAENLLLIHAVWILILYWFRNKRKRIYFWLVLLNELKVGI